MSVKIFTQEPCSLDLLYTWTKPTRKAVFQLRNSKRVVHSYRYTMHDVKRLAEISASPTTVHQWFFDFGELSDILYYIALQPGQEPDGGPQTPLFAWRIPLTLLYTTDLATDPPTETWDSFANPPESITYATPGAFGLVSDHGFFPFARLEHRVALDFPPHGPSTDGLFILFDGGWINRNNTDNPFYFTQFNIVNFDQSANHVWFKYGDVSTDPCTTIGGLFGGNFRPHQGTLFCLDLIMSKTADLCGTPVSALVDPRLNFFRDWVYKDTSSATPPSDAAVLHNYAIYQLAGPMQYLGRRWPYFRPLLPQIGGPRLRQRPLPH